MRQNSSDAVLPSVLKNASVSSTLSLEHSLIVNNQNHKVETINDNPEV